MKSRIQAVLVVVGIFVAGFIAMRFLKPSQNSNSQFKNYEERRMPCGRILQRTVEERDGVWTKTVRLLDPYGKELMTKSYGIEPEVCDRIRGGVFVPGLWGRDGALGCLRGGSDGIEN